MLDSIQVKNVALIDAAEVEFEKGLNILTGETGAGKSILLSSVQLALGAKADKSLIRQGAEYASVTLSFSPSKAQREQLHNMDIDCEDDILILQNTESSVYLCVGLFIMLLVAAGGTFAIKHRKKK